MHSKAHWGKWRAKPGFFIGLSGLLLGVAAAGLVALNGLVLAKEETAVVGHTGQPAAAISEAASGATIKILAYNIAKGFIHHGGLSFAPPEETAQRIEQIAAIIRAEQPDLVFLSEIVAECGPSPGNQVTALAEATGMHAWGFGENYNLGVPWYRIVGGNAILSRFPLEPVENISLVGRKPFFITTNNRRMLWCATQIAGRRVLLAAVHTDSFDLTNNLRQTQQMVAYLKGRPAILAGDFNANPSEPSMQFLKASGLFSGAFEGPLTFPSHQPQQRLDYILAPTTWPLLESRVLSEMASDHLPVVSVFRVPKA